MPHADPSLSLAERVDAACDRFESEWKAGRKPRIEDYLAAAQESDRQELRQALLAIELELQGRGQADTSVSQSSIRSDDKVVPVMTVDHVAGPPESSTTVGRFEIRGVLGSGAFGKVYRAFDPQLGREVALKVPLESAVKTEAERHQFLKEARAAATINHPNVCQIHEVGEHDGRPYIVMALVPGQSLAEALKARKEPMAEKQAALIVRKVAQALAAAHDKGIVHRDLKPANVMFDRERKDIVVMDFGLARGPKVADARATQSGVIMGTPAYMSPEQARGESKAVGPAGDVFSLGVILYELLTGARPFNGTATEVIGQILHVDPEPPLKRRPNLDPRLEAVCLKAIAKDPAARFTTMKEFAVAIDAILRTPQPTGPAAETAKAEDTRQNTEQPGTATLGEVFAVLSADRKQARAETAAAVEAAIARHRTPRWVFVLAGLLLVGGLTALGGIIFFTRSDKVKVTIELTDVDLADKSLSFFLDEEPIAAETLAHPIELKPGEHVLVVKRGKEIVKRVLLTVAGGRSPGLKYRDITLPPRQESPPRSAGDADRELATWFLRNGLHVGVTTGDRPTTYEQIDGHWRWITRQEELPKESFQLIGIGQIYKQISPEAIKRIGEVKNLVYLSLFGCAPVDDASLADISNCRELVWLNAEVTKVTDAGLKHLSGMKNLQRLELGHTTVTGTGLADMPDAPLAWLSLASAGNGTPEAVQAICRFKQLRALWLRSDRNGDREAQQLFRSLPRLKGLFLLYPRLTDDGLAGLSELKDLEKLALAYTRINGNGLRHLAGLSALREVYLQETPLTNEGLRHLRQVPRLAVVWAGDTRITDTGLAHLRGMETLQELRVPGTALTDAGLKHLPSLRNLHVLSLDGTRITDEGLQHLGDCRALGSLWLTNTAVTDVGLERLKTMRQLSTLGLAKTGVTDAGLKHLVVIRSLKELDLKDTAVTADGLRRLKAALPECKITPEPPTAGPDRAAAEWVLGLGGDVQVELAGKRSPAKAVTELPTGEFVLVSASLANNSKVTDDGLTALAGAKRMESLNLNGTSITSRGVAKLGQLTGLKYLNLCVRSVGDTDVAVLAALPNLYALEISYTQVGDAGLEQLKNCKGLHALYLAQTKVTDAGLEHLKKLPQLSTLVLTKTGVTDAGLKHLMGIRSLKELDLRDTAITASGLADLRKALPDCEILPKAGKTERDR
jgi:Leucine-rich repeat (LRR) protein